MGFIFAFKTELLHTAGQQSTDGYLLNTGYFAQVEGLVFYYFSCSKKITSLLFLFVSLD